MAEIWGAAIAGAAAVGGAVLSSQGAKDAAAASARGSDAAIAEDRRQFDLMRQDTEPYRQIGQQALGALGGIYGYRMPSVGYDTSSGTGSGPSGIDPNSGWRINPNGSVTRTLQQGADDGTLPTGGAPGPDYSNFFASPDYQFRRDEGTRGIERSFAARGLGGSGNALAALAQYNSNLAAGEFGNYFNRQAALAGIGQSAVNTATQAGSQSAANIGNALMAGANARASGIGNSADAWGNALGTIGGIAYDRWGYRGK